jgi:hypothetical protein
VSSLWFNKREQAAVAAGQNYDCGLQYHRSHICTNCNNVIKKGKYKNCKIIKMQWFLTILFASLICKWAAVVAGQKYVCELRYRKSRVLPKNSNLI